MKKIDTILKRFNTLPTHPLASLFHFFTDIYPSFTEKNLDYHNGIIRIVSIPSGVRLKILLQKNIIQQEAKKNGLIVRDIL